MQSFRTPTLLAAAIAAVLAMPAAAQESSAGGALEEIVVTATKRAEAIQDVPISVVAVTGESLAKLNQTDFLAISARTPTLQYSQAGGEGQLYIRGIGSNLLAVGADPSVAVHLDGVYLGRPNMGLSQFLDVDRIEVLRGPQGTLYGRNATGGSINMISKQPTKEWDGYAGVGFGSFSRIEAKGALGGPLSETLSFRLAGRYVTDDGYVEDLDQRGGTHLDDQNLKSFRGILRWEPSAAVRASLSWDHSEFNNANTAVRPLDNLGAAQALGAIPTGSLLEERNDLPTFMDYRTGGPTLTFDWDVTDGATLTSITAYKTFEMNFFFNTDGTEKDITRTTETFDTSQFSQELRLASNGDGRLQWLLGAYYFDESKDGALGLVRVNIGANPGTFIIPAENDTEAWAVFGELSYRLTDTLKLTVGARYSDESKDDVNAQYNVFANTPSSTTGAVATTSQVLMGLFGGIDYTQWPAASKRTGSASWSDVTPKVSLDWKPQDNLLFYASYTEGFKSGGFNDYQPSNPVYDPETVKSYEIGAKTEWLDGRVRFNAAAFMYDYKDLQVTTFFNSLTLVANATDAEITGVDLELVAKPTEALELGASVSWLDATYDTFMAPYGRCNAAVIPSTYCPTGTTPGSVRLVDASGNRLNNAPELKSTAYVQYDWHVGDNGTLSVMAQVSYTDDIFFNAANDPVAMQSSYTLVDARVGYSMGENIEVSVYGKNLTDEEYVHNIVQFTSTSVNPPDVFSVGNALGYPAPGRTYGLDLTYRF